MENNQVTSDKPVLTQDQMIAAIYEHTRKTMNYMKWQLYITIVLIVLPLLATLILIPIAMKSVGTLSGVYGPGGLLSQ